MKRFWKTFQKILGSICLTDRILLLFAILLLGYIVLDLSIYTGTKQNATVDTVIRTSLASIFGYFISINFSASTESSSANPPPVQTIHEEKTTSTNSLKLKAIGFDAGEETSYETPQKIPASTKNSTSLNVGSRFQIYVISFIGISSLIILLWTGNFQNLTAELMDVLSQLRDFVAASIGFLISYKKDKIH